MRPLALLGLVVVTLFPLSADAQSAPATITLHLRAIQPLPTSAVKAIAAFGEPTVLTKANYPDAKHFTAKHIIEVLCGSYREGYWQATVDLNALGNTAPQHVLGERVYTIKWPACAYVIQPSKRLPLVVYNRTNAANLYKELTGASGSEDSIRYYFRESGVADIGRIQAGAELVPSHVTVYRNIHVTDPKAFQAALSKATTNQSDKYVLMSALIKPTSATSSAGGNPTSPFPVSGHTKLEIAAGHIEGVATGSYKSPAECTQTPPQPALDVQRILAAYALARRAAALRHLDQYPTAVFVADNGFFGAQRTPSRVQFGPGFPEGFFYTADTYGDGQISPVVREGQQTPVYPINYSNSLSQANYVSGHGTHVVGLVLGGELFHSHLNILQRSDGQPWLRVIVLNIGKGGEELLPGSEQQLDTQVEMQKNRIVNLSLEYSDDTDQTVQAIFSKMMLSGEENQNLFVVAAGNDSDADVISAPYYPAAFGGNGLNRTANVISVAAHLPNGALANFSNRGADAVDIAAPGCDLGSWVDDSPQVVKLSGTSQAAAVATFAAALVRSLGNFDPASIKGRLMTSGDLLTDSPGIYAASGALLPSPSQIFSRSKLNIPVALYVFDDYVRYRLKGDAADREILGHIDSIRGVRCEGDAAEADWSDIWALKMQGSEGWLYKGRRARVVRKPCKAALTSTAVLSLRERAALGPEGRPMLEKDTAGVDAMTIDLSGVSAVVASLPAVQP